MTGRKGQQMVERNKRLQAIVDIIEQRPIGTQEELTQALREQGFPVTQATVSRDIRILHLGKVRQEDGRPRYTVQKSQSDAAASFVRVMKEAVVSMDQAQNILVIRTVSGMAMAAAVALDSLHYPEVVGCIAGDDTIFAAVRTVEETTGLLHKIRTLLQG